MTRFVIVTVVAISFVLSLVVWNCRIQKKTTSHYEDPYPGIVTRQFIPLPVGAVRPEGWLKKTLHAWASGITGHLHEYRPDTFWDTWDNRLYRIKQMQNEGPVDRGIGTTLWAPFEQQGYWANGIVELAYILDDERLKNIADEFINKMLAGQNPDGYMGIRPDKPYGDTGDIYVLGEVTLGLISYYSATEDPRIIPAMQKAFRHMYANCRPLSGEEQPFPGGFDWEAYLSNEALDDIGATEPAIKFGLHPAWVGTGWPYSCHIIDAILWVYARTGDQQMKNLADVIYQAIQEVPSDFQVKNLLLDGYTLRDHHGVDVTETVRIPALYYLYSGNMDDLNASIKGIESVDRYHGQAHGSPASDEHLREKGAVSNTEFCVHATWSATKQKMFAISGEVKYADGIETIMFNAGPGASTPNGRAIQYFTAPNQVACTNTSCNTPVHGPNAEGQFLRPDGIPDIQCCSGESTRLYPNYVSSAMWLASPDHGLAAACYSPSTVSAKVGEQGKMVTISEKTNYPFEEKIRFEIQSSESMKFPLYLRIPGWCNEASIEINEESYAESLRPGRMVRIDRVWSSGDQIDLNLPMHVRFSRRDGGSVAVERGPLVYALKIKHNWKKVAERFPGFPDRELRPGSPWNYALILDLSYGKGRTPDADSYFTVKYPEVPEGSNPWEYPPIELVCKAKKVDGWEILDGDVTPHVPQSPIINDNPEEEVTLVPYGSTRIRITYFPVAEVK